MAFRDYLDACNSTLYDGNPKCKALLQRIASLMRSKQPHIGWCTASQEYLALTTGWSLSSVQRSVREMKVDGALFVRPFRDPRTGFTYNHYRVDPELVAANQRPKKSAVIEEEVADDDQMEAAGHPGAGWAGQPSDVQVDVTVTEPGRQGEVQGMYSVGSVETSNVIQDTPIFGASRNGHSLRTESTHPSDEEERGGSAPTPPSKNLTSSSSVLAQRPDRRTGLGSELDSCSPSNSGLGSSTSSCSGVSILPDPGQRNGSVPVPDRKEASGWAARPPAPTASPAVNNVPRPPAGRPGTGGTQKTSNSFQVARQNVEGCKKEDPDLYLQGHSLAKQLADYLEERKERGEGVYAPKNWEIFWGSDFIEALRNGRSFADLEDAIDISQTGSFAMQI